jgi:hypothetical protein
LLPQLLPQLPQLAGSFPVSTQEPPQLVWLIAQHMPEVQCALHQHHGSYNGQQLLPQLPQL